MFTICRGLKGYCLVPPPGTVYISNSHLINLCLCSTLTQGCRQCNGMCVCVCGGGGGAWF